MVCFPHCFRHCRKTGVEGKRRGCHRDGVAELFNAVGLVNLNPRIFHHHRDMDLVSEINCISLDEDEEEDMISEEIAEIQGYNTLYYRSGRNLNYNPDVVSLRC